MKTLSILVLAILVIPVFAQGDTKAQQNNIQGTWQSNSIEDQTTLKLNADGSGEFDGESIRYTVKDNKFNLTIVAENQTIVYNYTLQENSLTISGGDLDEPVKFSRKGTQVQVGK